MVIAHLDAHILFAAVIYAQRVINYLQNIVSNSTYSTLSTRYTHTTSSQICIMRFCATKIKYFMLRICVIS